MDANNSHSDAKLSFKRNKLEKDAKKNWDLFYKRNGDRFFKDRHWTKREFVELLASEQKDHHNANKAPRVLLEIGCGCGNFALPLIRSTTNACKDESDSDEHQTADDVSIDDLFIYCCDISERAIDILRNNAIYMQNHPQRIKAFVADITDEHVCEEIFASQLDAAHQIIDMASLIFVLSAVDPMKMATALRNIHKLLRPNGLVLMRDYAQDDGAMLRFDLKPECKLDERFYVRQDGTRAYFFNKQQLCDMFSSVGFACQSIEYVKRETLNRATNERFARIFVQAKFIKLPDA